MKVTSYLLVFLAVLFSCHETDMEIIGNQQIAEGHYEGWYSYGGSNYWCLIQFEGNRYEEWPSGGAMFQKSMACLTTGTYHANDNKLIFNIGTIKHKGFPDSCDTNTMLPGTYEMIPTSRQDSLVFAKGDGDSRIIYHIVNRMNLGE